LGGLSDKHETGLVEAREDRLAKEFQWPSRPSRLKFHWMFNLEKVITICLAGE